LQQIQSSPSITGGEKQAALESVLKSDTFARSEQLRSFLRFVCETEIAGRGSEITEYLIGVKALGRSEDYSPLEDSSVRTRAYELRQRLHKYYTVEQPGAALRIELPKGSYVPRFVTEPVAAEVPSPEVVTVQAVPPVLAPVAQRSGWRVGLALALLAVGVGAGWLAGSRQTRRFVDPMLREAWEPILSKDPEVLICLATPLHMLVSPHITNVPQEISKYPAPPEIYPLFSRYRPLQPDAQLDMQPVQKAVTMGDVQSLTSVIDTLHVFEKAYRVLPETNSPLTAMQRRSVVLIGSPWYSRSASTLLADLPWMARPDVASGEIGIFGQGVRQGDRYMPKRGPRGQYMEVFGLLTVLQNEGDDGRTKVVYSGLTSVGVHGAAAFFSSPKKLKELEGEFRKAGIREWPRSYQVIVRCQSSDDAQLLSYAYEASQVITR
jgi:hypothetical protein